jgi:hypothetical protein
VAPDDEFGHQRRMGQSVCKQEVYENEGSPAIAGGIGRESPDIAETNGGTRGRHQKTET